MWACWVGSVASSTQNLVIASQCVLLRYRGLEGWMADILAWWLFFPDFHGFASTSLRIMMNWTPLITDRKVISPLKAQFHTYVPAPVTPVSRTTSYVGCEKYKITKIDFLKVALLIIYNLREFLMGIDGANLFPGDGDAPLHPVLILPDFNNNRPSM